MMNSGNRKIDLERPATYQIKVQGRLDERMLDWFGEMTVTVEGQGHGPAITTLIVTVVDQAALQGLLRTLYTLRLSVQSVSCLDP